MQLKKLANMAVTSHGGGKRGRGRSAAHRAQKISHRIQQSHRPGPAGMGMIGPQKDRRVDSGHHTVDKYSHFHHLHEMYNE